ncbi:hypothetical protein F4821DRAFT_234399 [Hypoxylon rubiginosum]|uniref:Uncharacterized protein n=1 Tax=Hypoxylon rubiginosum TaxID=110542 RepID=A0ACC0D6J2_9PEZI|nr:hypothetical protein F4821DRAFT_234399 [Hypoxylon rubiginosum]
MSSLLPFLYQTRTILRVNPRATIVFTRSLHGNRQLRKRDDIPFVSELDYGETRVETETETETNDDDTPSEPTRRGTITPLERQIFEGIFADIRARGLKPTLREDSSAPTSDAARSTMQIMQQAVQDAGQARPAHVVAPHLLAGPARNRQQALLRFPPDLRAAASRALDTIGTSVTGYPEHDDIRFDESAIAAGHEYVDEGWKAPLDRSFDLEAKRRPERTRIEGLIAAAKTDFKLWDVLEKEVFIMPAKLGLNTGTSELEDIESTKLAEMKGKKAGARSETGALEEVHETDTTVPESSSSAEKLSIYIHGPLYPAYLLLALRRLDRAFRTPSPLAFTILPRIKELGLESYVLGVTTPFYNELLQIYWTRRGDLSGMLDLLDEMRQCGLYFDEQTKSILSNVEIKMRDLADEPTSGSFTRAVMDMPEYGLSIRERIQEWHKSVDLSIRERENDRQRERSVGY